MSITLPSDLAQRMEEESTNILVLSKPDNQPCPKCKATIKAMERGNLHFSVSKSLNNPDHVEFLVKVTEGAQSAPGVIVTNDNGEIVEAWADFRISKIQELGKNYATCAA